MQSGFEVENSGQETSILEPLKIGFFFAGFCKSGNLYRFQLLEIL